VSAAGRAVPVTRAFAAEGTRVERLGRVAFGVAVLMWAYGLAAHALVVAGAAPPVLDPPLVGAVGVAAIWAARWPYWSRAFPVVPVPPLVPVLAVLGLGCMLWPTVVGSGVSGTHRLSFGDGGVPTGLPGDRYLTDHGRRVRTLTEAEYQQTQEWAAVERSGFSAGAAAMVLGYAVYCRRVRNTLHPTRPATSASESS
jgi:hypothetical protein